MQQYKYFELSGIGPKKTMQDYGIVGKGHNEQFYWYIIADGIGGELHGEIAAEITVEGINEYLSKTIIKESKLKNNLFFEEALNNIQQKFKQLTKKDSSYNKMGCTLCLLILTNQKGYVYWSGDSRLYLFRDKRIYWDTLPHNWSFDLYRKGVISLSDARLSESNYLTGSVNGYVKKIRYDSFIFDIKAKDRILICTDGIWALFEHDELAKEFGTKTLNQIQTKLSAYLAEYANDNYFGYVIESI